MDALLATNTPEVLTGSKQRPALRNLLHVFPTFGFGGVPIRIANIINQLAEKFRHTIVSMDGSFDCARRIHPDVRIQFEHADGSKYGLLVNTLSYRNFIKKLGPDLLLTYNWGTTEWAWANNLAPMCPHIHFESGFGIEEADWQIWRRVLFRRIALARTSRLIVPSHHLVDIATRIWKLDPRKVLHIVNGVDCDRFACAPVPGIPHGFSKRSEELIIGTVAPLRTEKNLGRLIRAYSQLPERPDARLMIIGEGPERPKLAALASALGIDGKVIFGGHVDQVENVLGWFDVFALSSDTEQMPNSVLQAMAAGRPIASVDVGDVRRMLAPANRELVVPRDDERQLRDALGRLLSDAHLRAKLGRENQAHARQHYSQERMVQAYEAAFNGAL